MSEVDATAAKDQGSDDLEGSRGLGVQHRSAVKSEGSRDGKVSAGILAQEAIAANEIAAGEAERAIGVSVRSGRGGGRYDGAAMIGVGGIGGGGVGGEGREQD